MKKILTLSLLVLSGAMVAGTVGAIASNDPPVETKAEGQTVSYIDKFMTPYDLQLSRVADNRITASILVPADKGLDFAEGQLIRYAYNTDDGKDSQHGNCHILELAAEGETAASIKARVYALNLFRGSILIDGVPVTDDKGSGTDVLRLWEYSEANHGRITLTRNADGGTEGTSNRLKIAIDICLPGYTSTTSREHTIEFVKGMELPSMSYALNKDLGNTPKNSVYRFKNSAKFKFKENDFGNMTCTGIDNAQEDVLISKVGFGPLASYSARVADGRYGFRFSLVSDATKKNSTYYPDDIQYNVHADPTHGEYKPDSYAMAALKTWDFIEYNPDPLGAGEWVAASTKRTDDRLYNGYAKYYDNHAAAWFDLKLGADSPSTVGIRLKKGCKFPSNAWLKAEEAGDHTKRSYVEVNGDYTFIYEKQADGQYLQTDVMGANREDLSSYCVPTDITGLSLHNAGQDNWCYGGFTLTEYDGDKGNFCYNNQTLTASGEYNAWENTYVEGKHLVAKTPSGTEVATRIARIYVNNKEVGFPMPLSKTGAGVDTIVVKAGTRFPALSYIAAEKDNADSPLGSTKKFYVTTKDVTLVKVADGQYQDIEILRAEAKQDVADLVAEVIDNYSEPVQAQIAAYVAELNGKIDLATTKEAIDELVDSAVVELGKLPTKVEEERCDAVKVLISALKAKLDKLTLDDLDEVVAARTAYDNLTEREQGFMGSSLKDLEAAELIMRKLIAINALNTTYPRDAYRAAEQALYDAEIAKINAAETMTDLEAAIGAATNAIDALKTNAQYLAEELAAAKEEAIGLLENYLDETLYTYTINSTYKTALANAKKKVNAVTAIENLEAAVAEAKALLDAVPTDAEIDAERESACEQITQAFNQINPEEYTVNYEEMTEMFEYYKERINASVVLEGAGSIKGLVQSFKSYLAYYESDADLVASLISQIDELPDPETFEYETCTSTEYSAINRAWTDYSSLTDSLKAQVTNAQKLESLKLAIKVYELLNLYWRDADYNYFGVDTIYQQLYPTFRDADLAALKEVYDDIMEEIATATKASEFDDEAMASAFYQEYMTFMYSDPEYIEVYLLAISVKEGVLSAEDVALINEFGVKAAFEQAHIEYLLANIPAWNGFETLEEMMEAYEITMEDIENFYGPLSLEHFYGEDAMDYYNSITPVLDVMDLIDAIGTVELTPESKAKIDAARAAYDALAPEAAAKVANLNTLVAAEVAYEALVEAAELAEAKVAAKAELEAYKNAADYREAEQAQLAKAIEDGKAAVEAATSKEAVASAVTAAKAVMDALKTKAEYEAEEAAALAAAKAAAKADLDAMKAGLDMSKYTAENQAAIEKAVTDGKAAIDAATSVEAVSSAKAAAVAAINAVPQITPEPQPEPAKKGCGGSIIAASGIVTLVTLLGAGLICAKRKED